MSTTTAIRIVPFEDHHADAFRRVNVAWIEPLFALEPLDHEQLGAPRRAILEPGGHIWIAESVGTEGVTVVGTCALLAHGADFELAKMAVVPDVRGRGVGGRLLEHALTFARHSGAPRVVLATSSRLEAAIRLYRRAGFRTIDLKPEDAPYTVCDVAMEYVFTPSEEGDGRSRA